METGKILIILGAILTLLGTYVFAIYGSAGLFAGSGIGFIINLPDLFGNADAIALATGWDVIFIYIFTILFLIFLASGILQLAGIKYRILAFIFSLFPLVVGAMILILFYTDILGPTTGIFTLYFIGEHFADFFPIIVNLGDVGLGTYFLVAGGALGLVSVFLPRD
ncbi:MAG: hypothetical protein EU531_09185 [Promethearchaeota archaeon]|nr:MAG: hypothetical protein EU531_09185 [Candidatus Lokiarchaeota archaeon]